MKSPVTGVILLILGFFVITYVHPHVPNDNWILGLMFATALITLGTRHVLNYLDYRIDQLKNTKQ